MKSSGEGCSEFPYKILYIRKEENTMPAAEIRAQTFEKKSLPSTSCTRKYLPCSTQNFELFGDESVAIVLNGSVSTEKMEETTGKFETVKLSRCSQNGFEGQNKEAENKETTKVQERCNKAEKSERSCAKTSAYGACVPPSASSGLTIKGNRAIALRDLRVSTSSLESDEELITDIMKSLTVNVAFSPKSPASFFNVSTS